MAVKKSEDRPSASAEEDIRERSGTCTHSGYNCTTFGYMRKIQIAPGPKPVFRTVVSEQAMEVTCSSQPADHANGHKRTITPGTFTGLVLQANVRACMNINEIARAYVEKIGQQQRAQSKARFPLIRYNSEIETHYFVESRL